MKKTIITFLSAIIVFLGGSTLGSVARSSEYTPSYSGSLTVGHNLIVGNNPVTLGQITVASTSAGTLKVWNATSTTDSASTTVALLKASVVEGTYVFDAFLTRGLIVELGAGFNGAYTITYRQN